jgi:hypothetical protein
VRILLCVEQVLLLLLVVFESEIIAKRVLEVEVRECVCMASEMISSDIHWLG